MRWSVALLVVAGCSKPIERTPAVTLGATSSSPRVSTRGTLLPPVLPATIAWRWDGDVPGFGRSFYRSPREVIDGALSCTFTYDEHAYSARTACALGGRELWHHDDAYAFVEDAALVIDHDVLYGARISNISSGCTVHAFDARRGTEKWATRLRGLGPIAHSEYLNAVQLRIVSGFPVVFGWETGGRYIEALDPATGATTRHALVP
jgi:hypothetical protein